jgi:hypothetical protein
VTDVEDLRALLIRRARELGGRNGELSTRMLEQRSEPRVSRGTFQRIMAGEHSGRLDVPTLRGIAKAIEESLEAVERAAAAPRSYGPFKLPPNAERLTPAQRRAVRSVVHSMLEPAPEETEDLGRPHTVPLRAAAKKRPGDGPQRGRGG